MYFIHRAKQKHRRSGFIYNFNTRVRVKAQSWKTEAASVPLSINSTSGSAVNNAAFLIRTSVDSSCDGIQDGAIVTAAPVSLSGVFTVSPSYL